MLPGPEIQPRGRRASPIRPRSPPCSHWQQQQVQVQKLFTQAPPALRTSANWKMTMMSVSAASTAAASQRGDDTRLYSCRCAALTQACAMEG